MNVFKRLVSKWWRCPKSFYGSCRSFFWLWRVWAWAFLCICLILNWKFTKSDFYFVYSLSCRAMWTCSPQLRKNGLVSSKMHIEYVANGYYFCRCCCIKQTTCRVFIKATIIIDNNGYDILCSPYEIANHKDGKLVSHFAFLSSKIIVYVFRTSVQMSEFFV